MGAAFFMLFGIATYATQRGKRDFTSTSQVVATNYDVIVAIEAAHEARRLLHQLPMNSAQAATGQAQNYSPPNAPLQQPGQAPDRPATWNDPYGQRGPEPTESDASGAQAPTAQPAQPAQNPTPSPVRYPDLPDGRPQYGVRVTEGQNAPRQEEQRPGNDDSHKQ